MEWKLFLSTFTLIFLAELGDKTQLTAMMYAADAKSPWQIFWAASAALVCSTFLAVLFGSTMAQYLPPSLLKGVAGVLFLAFGALSLYSAFQPESEKPAVSEAPAPLGGGTLVRLAVEMAATFEEATLKAYEEEFEQTRDEGLKALLTRLLASERQHLHELKSLTQDHTTTILPESSEPVPPLSWSENAPMSPGALDFLEHAAAQEEHIARFYRQLAKVVHISSLKTAFSSLAQQEEDHAKMLRNHGQS